MASLYTTPTRIERKRNYNIIALRTLNSKEGLFNETRGLIKNFTSHIIEGEIVSKKLNFGTRGFQQKRR